MNIFSMWKNTRMVVLVAVTAALYVAILLPFKFATVIPGFTEIRPGAAIPVVCSIFFGPAAAWGAAIGNLVGDIYGNMLTAGSIAGFVGNFLYGLIPFLFWQALARGEKSGLLTVRKIVAFILGCLLASAVCAAVIAVGVKYLAGAPDDVVKGLLITIFLNNTAMGIIIGGILLTALYSAVSALGLTYDKLRETVVAGENDLELEGAAPAPAGQSSAPVTVAFCAGMVLILAGFWGWKFPLKFSKLFHASTGDTKTFLLIATAGVIVGALILLASSVRLWLKPSR